MIKRRFYKHDHGNRDDPSESSSSSSDSEVEAEATEETEEEDDAEEVEVVEVRVKDGSCSSSSGYESEDSSANEVNLDSSGLLASDDDMRNGSGEQNVSESHSCGNGSADIVEMQCNSLAESGANPSDIAGCVLKFKSVFKCKLCPRIVCLTEETLNAHLKSKRHARSEKLLHEGRLRIMLNSDGEIEGETYLERQARTVAIAEKKSNSRRNHKRPQKQRTKTKNQKRGPTKKRRRNDN